MLRRRHMISTSLVIGEGLEALEADESGRMACLLLVRLVEAGLTTEELLTLGALDRYGRPCDARAEEVSLWGR